MTGILGFWRSVVGKKVVMGVTGLIMIGFLVGHMLGNLQAFLGAERYDAYSHFLHSLGEGLWLIRAVLLLALVLHVVAAVQLTLIDRAARPVAYAKVSPQAATPASRTLRIGGLVLLAFIIFHLLHLTTGDLHPDFREGEVYHNLVTGLANPLVAGFYLVALVAVGLHVFHGAWASFRSLGASQPAANPRHRPIARVIAVAVWLGFSLLPVAVLLGWLH